MDREKLFEEFINECEKEPLTLCGQGNPNVDILIIGKESTDISEKSLVQNIERCRNKMERDAPRPINPKNKTWANYQYLLDEIYQRKSDYDDKWDFEKYAFTTELSSTPRKNSKYSEAKSSIQDRLRFFEKSKFIQDFPVIVLACGGYIRNNDKVREIDDTFHVTFSKRYDYSTGNWFCTHYDDTNPKRIVIHTRQLSNGVSYEMIDKMASVIRDHLDHLKKLGLI